MKYGFSTLGCPDWLWDDIITAASDLGFDGVELRGIDKEVYLPNIKILSEPGLSTAKADLQRLGLVVPCLTSGVYLFDWSLAMSARKEAQDYIDLAVRMGVPYVRVLADRNPNPGPVDEGAVFENLEIILPKAQAAGVTLLVETNGVYADSTKLRQLCERLDHPSLGVLWDIHHPYRYFGESVRTTYHNLAQYIKHIHVKDSVMTDGKLAYRMTGCGDVPIREALAVLQDGGYDGFIVLEWVKRWNMDLESPGIVLPHFLNEIKKM